jgi:hypothetical protein
MCCLLNTLKDAANHHDLHFWTGVTGFVEISHTACLNSRHLGTTTESQM